MTHSFTIHLSADFVRRVNLRQRFGKRTFFIYGSAYISLLAFNIFIRLVNGKTREFFSNLGIFFTLTTLAFVSVFLITYLSLTRRSKAAVGNSGHLEIKYELDDTHLKCSSVLEQTSLVWKTIKRVSVYKEFLLLFFENGNFLLFPTNQTPEDAQKFLLEKTAAAGAIIKT